MTDGRSSIRWRVVLISVAVFQAATAGLAQLPPTAERPATEAPDSEAPQPALPGGLPSHLQLRDPFWPVDFNPNAGQEAEQAKKPKEKKDQPVAWQDAIKQLSIRGVMKMDAGYVAMVSEQVVRPNDIVTVDYLGNRYRWKVRSISEKGVRFEPLDVNSVK